MTQNRCLRMAGKHPRTTSVNFLYADLSVLKLDEYFCFWHKYMWKKKMKFSPMSFAWSPPSVKSCALVERPLKNVPWVSRTQDSLPCSQEPSTEPHHFIPCIKPRIKNLLTKFKEICIKQRHNYVMKSGEKAEINAKEKGWAWGQKKKGKESYR